MVFSVLAVTTLAAKYSGIFSAVRQYGGKFFAVGGFTSFGVNDLSGSGKTKIWRYFFGGNAIRRYFFGGMRLFVFRR